MGDTQNKKRKLDGSDSPPTEDSDYARFLQNLNALKIKVDELEARKLELMNKAEVNKKKNDFLQGLVKKLELDFTNEKRQLDALEREIQIEKSFLNTKN